MRIVCAAALHACADGDKVYKIFSEQQLDDDVLDQVLCIVVTLEFAISSPHMISCHRARRYSRSECFGPVTSGMLILCTKHQVLHLSPVLLHACHLMLFCVHRPHLTSLCDVRRVTNQNGSLQQC